MSLKEMWKLKRGWYRILIVFLNIFLFNTRALTNSISETSNKAGYLLRIINNSFKIYIYSIRQIIGKILS